MSSRPKARTFAVVGCLALVAAVVAARGGASSLAASTTTPAVKPSPATLALGKAVFKANCTLCHTLAAAGAHGSVGPNLDKVKPTQARVIRQVTNGGGVMPSFKGRLSAAKIKAVAAYVSTVAGKKVSGGGGGGGGTP